MTIRPRRARVVAAAMAAAALLVLTGCGSGSDADTTLAAPAGPDISRHSAGGAAASAEAPRGGATGGVGTAGTAVAKPMRFTAAAVDGSTINGAALATKPTVAWFWTPWCSICRAEAPEVAAMASKYAGKVNVVGIAGLGKLADMKRFVDDTGVIGFAHAVDADGTLWRGFGVIGQPSFAFVHPGGKVEVVPGSLSPADLDARIEAMIGA